VAGERHQGRERRVDQNHGERLLDVHPVKADPGLVARGLHDDLLAADQPFVAGELVEPFPEVARMERRQRGDVELMRKRFLAEAQAEIAAPADRFERAPQGEELGHRQLGPGRLEPRAGDIGVTKQPGDVPDRAHVGVARVVDDDIEPAERRDGRGHRRARGRGLRDVELHGADSIGVLLDERSQALGVAGSGHEAIPRGEHGLGELETETARASSDQPDLRHGNPPLRSRPFGSGSSMRSEGPRRESDPAKRSSDHAKAPRADALARDTDDEVHRTGDDVHRTGVLARGTGDDVPRAAPACGRGTGVPPSSVGRGTC
jgi:hypothetical protein